MKIGLAHRRLDLQGETERDLDRTAEGLMDRGHEIHLFCQEYRVEPPRGSYAHYVRVLPFGRTIRLWSYILRSPYVIARSNAQLKPLLAQRFET